MEPVLDLYAGIELAGDHLHLDQGGTLQRTYAHLIAPFQMAFNRPHLSGQHRPAPWKTLGVGFFTDIVAEISLPASLQEKFGPLTDVAQIIVMMLRLGVHSAIAWPAYANHPFATMRGLPAGSAVGWSGCRVKSELRSSVSAFIASYLETPGKGRADLQQVEVIWSTLSRKFPRH